MILRFSRLLASLALLAGPVHAQFINRAVWLGDERESFRRDYGQDAEYFLNRASYVDQPPWWFTGTRDPFRNQLSVAAGSVTSTELTVEAVANVGIEMGRGFTGRFNYLQSEHQTSRFERFAVGIDRAVSDSSSIFVQLEGTADKSRSDISFGMELFRSEHSAHRVSFTVVDFAKGKSKEFEYERNQYKLRGPAYDYPKPANTRRILMLGDSFTFGTGVASNRELVRFE